MRALVQLLAAVVLLVAPMVAESAMTSGGLDPGIVAARAQSDPVWFVRTILGEEPWAKQVEILQSLRDYRVTVVKSCHGIGKSWVASRGCLWFGASHYESQTITTAPGARQVEGIIWAEIPVAHSRAKFPIGGRLTNLKLEWAKNWKIWGFTSNQYNENTFQGFHAKSILVVGDEASGLTPNIMKGIKAVITSEHARLLLIGNPTDPMSPFAGYFKRDDPNINKITVSAFDTPNFTHFGITIDDIRNRTWREKITGPLPAPHLVTPEWVAEVYDDCGEEDPYWVSRVMAQFPTDDPTTLIPLSWIEAAQNRDYDPQPGDTNVLGVDVAYAPKGDEAAIAHRHGGRIRIPFAARGMETMEYTGNIIAQLALTGASAANVDMAGVGAPIVHRLAELNQPAQGIMVGAASTQPERFANLRAQYFWALRSALDPKQNSIVDLDPTDQKLAAQLSCLKYKHRSSGALLVESKDDMKKRGLKSPDRVDAAMLTYAPVDEQPGILV